MKKWILRILSGIITVIIIFYLFIQLFTGKALQDVDKYLKTTKQVEFIDDPWLIFKPREQQVKAGFVFYPGGLVDAESYSRLMSYLAQRGIVSVITPVGMRIAFTNKNAAHDVIKSFPKIKKWFIGGHSLGGVVASFFLRDNKEDKVCGVILLGSFLPDKNRITNIKLPTISIYGTNDGYAHIFEPTKYNFSPKTTMHKIEGGNHGQFGYYGFHIGKDKKATISREKQQSTTEKLVYKFIENTLKK
ncbi:alpha/beta family hydrolase [Spirochaetota bacterium]